MQAIPSAVDFFIITASFTCRIAAIIAQVKGPVQHRAFLRVTVYHSIPPGGLKEPGILPISKRMTADAAGRSESRLRPENWQDRDERA